jgi:diguanylate cyclase (GGDEF)-like protein
VKWSAEIKNKFSIYILCSDVDRGVSIKAALFQEGYDAYLFSDGEALYGRLESAPPHLIVLAFGSLEVPLEEFVQHIVNINSEIRFLPLWPITEVQNILGYREFNFSAPVVEGEGWLPRLVWSADEICKSLYYVYQNEQVYSLMESSNQESERLRQEMALAERRAEGSMGVILSQATFAYQDVKTKEDVLSIFLRELNQKMLSRNKKVSAVYFRYLPTVQSFVVLQALGVDLDQIKGIGGRLTLAEGENPNQAFVHGGAPEQLKNLMSEGFHVHNCVYKSIIANGELDGFFAAWCAEGELFPEEIENEFALFVLMYERCHLIRKLNSIDLADTVTEMYGHQYYLKHLAEEVTRARRLRKPVTVLRMSIDYLTELSQSLSRSTGRSGKDAILRTISSVMLKTARVNDISCRTGENEFTIILPHAPQKGALIRAERLRRLIEMQAQKVFGLSISMSAGVSEYPSHCSSAEDLDKAATKALDFVFKQGGNKVCLYQPESSFAPDFDISTM